MKRLREERGWSQAHLAERAGLSVQFVAALEQEGRSATLATLNKLADAFEVPVSKLFVIGERGPSADEVRVADALGQLLLGLTRGQQERILNAVREIRALVPKRTKG